MIVNKNFLPVMTQIKMVMNIKCLTVGVNLIVAHLNCRTVANFMNALRS